MHKKEGDAKYRGKLGGREVGGDGGKRNESILRCPNCRSKLTTSKGTLKDREGDDGRLPIPTDRSGKEFSSKMVRWWWALGDTREFQNVGLSKILVTPGRGPLRYVVCSDCSNGPLGYQLADPADTRVWLCCDSVVQQSISDAKRSGELEDDERKSMPSSSQMTEHLKQMVMSGMGSVEYSVTFAERRLGMMLTDAPDGKSVIVRAFTTNTDGEIGSAEKSGQIRIGDSVVGVDIARTDGMNYAKVLDLIVGAKRPVTIHFERKGTGPGRGKVNRAPTGPSERVLHVDWRGEGDGAVEDDGATKE